MGKAADAETLLVAGTESHAGKSTVAAGLCRLLARRGVSVAPFKAQNMSNNARAVPNPAGDWGEIGVSQYVQARAAGVAPTTDMNPVLLKPRGDGESQLVVQGDAVADVAAGSYYEDRWTAARRAAVESHERLAERHDVIVAEGAGSIAEINLRHRDLANIETARFADASVLLCVNIERGGAFASLYGTLELVPEDVRERIVGAVVTKFRGDPSLLTPGIEEIEERTGVPVLGVIPYDDPGLPEEDSVSLPPPGEGATVGGDDGVPAERAVVVGVPRLPRVSNFTDLEPLAAEPGVRVRYLPPEADLDGVDAVVLPGTKNTVDDLLALREAGFGGRLARFDGPVVGICGGYQMLGGRLTNAAVEGTGDRDAVDGFGLLPVETRFSTDKRVEEVTLALDGSGGGDGSGGDDGSGWGDGNGGDDAALLAGVAGTVGGYEIHTGRTTATGPVARPLGPGSAATERALGTYLHGLFENEPVREAFLAAVYRAAGRARPEGGRERGPSPYDRAADLVAEHVSPLPVP